MPLVGGGGAPNVAGSNPTGTGSSINYIGNHAYAMSGSVDVNNNETTLLEFTTQNSYIDAMIQFSYIQHAVQDYEYHIYMNDQVVWSTNLTTSGASQGTLFNLAMLIIPSYTKVKCTAQNLTDTNAFAMAATLRGTVY